MNKKLKPLHIPQPPKEFAPAKWAFADIGALQALMRGDALPHQQQHALRFIIEKVSLVDDVHYRPGGPEGDRATAFCCGRAFVGQQLRDFLKLNLKAIRSEEHDRSNPTESGASGEFPE